MDGLSRLQVLLHNFAQQRGQKIDEQYGANWRHVFEELLRFASANPRDLPARQPDGTGS